MQIPEKVLKVVVDFLGPGTEHLKYFAAEDTDLRDALHPQEAPEAYEAVKAMVQALEWQACSRRCRKVLDAVIGDSVATIRARLCAVFTTGTLRCLLCEDVCNRTCYTVPRSPCHRSCLACHIRHARAVPGDVVMDMPDDMPDVNPSWRFTLHRADRCGLILAAYLGGLTVNLIVGLQKNLQQMRLRQGIRIDGQVVKALPSLWRFVPSETLPLSPGGESLPTFVRLILRLPHEVFIQSKNPKYLSGGSTANFVRNRGAITPSSSHKHEKTGLILARDGERQDYADPAWLAAHLQAERQELKRDECYLDLRPVLRDVSRLTTGRPARSFSRHIVPSVFELVANHRFELCCHAELSAVGLDSLADLLTCVLEDRWLRRSTMESAKSASIVDLSPEILMKVRAYIGPGEEDYAYLHDKNTNLRDSLHPREMPGAHQAVKAIVPALFDRAQLRRCCRRLCEDAGDLTTIIYRMGVMPGAKADILGRGVHYVMRRPVLRDVSRLTTGRPARSFSRHIVPSVFELVANHRFELCCHAELSAVGLDSLADLLTCVLEVRAYIGPGEEDYAYLHDKNTNLRDSLHPREMPGAHQAVKAIVPALFDRAQLRRCCRRLCEDAGDRTTIIYRFGSALNTGTLRCLRCESLCGGPCYTIMRGRIACFRDCHRCHIRHTPVVESSWRMRFRTLADLNCCPVVL
ncbi:unnamed protein product [Symbiodinium natans]|uniref:Uncharacterized protein n=1 Tax=Symbiodinium natans TaxID=878477 RepID=A0A812QZE9_9DINO|nr:unnamed protein product [Symbiodinium natans]